MRGTDFSKRPGGAPDPEQARLDEAIGRADALLVSSLKTEERRRTRRKRFYLLLGGLAMLTTVSAIVIGLALQGQVAADSSAKLTQEGWQLWTSQQFDQAIPKFEAAVKLAPKNTNAWNGLGWSQFNSGQQDAAVKSFQKVIALEPRHPAALNGLGQINFFQRKYKDAEKYLLKAAPQASAAWYALAKLYLLEGEYDKARKWAKKLVDSGDADETAQQMLQAAEAKKLDPELRKAIEPAAPSAESANAGRGWQLFRQGRNAEAIEIFEKVLAADADNGAALNGLGWCLLNSGESEKAKPHFEKVIKQNPDASGALNGLANVLQNEGDLDGAIKIWEGMVKQSIDPQAAAPYELADAYLEKDEYAKAVPLLEKLVAAAPTNQQLKAKLARAQEKSAK